jgi:hypothetical protein
MKEKRDEYKFLVGKPEVKSPLEDRDVDARIILNMILNERDGRM